MNYPLVGVGVIIENNNKDILVGKRKASHAPYYSIPGGKIDLGESFESAAIREVFEETGMTLINPEVIGITNNLKTYLTDHIHFISVILYCNQFEGQPFVKEKEKCESWNWVNPNNLPQPHFEASTLSIQCFMQKCFYTQANYQL